MPSHGIKHCYLFCTDPSHYDEFVSISWSLEPPAIGERRLLRALDQAEGPDRPVHKAWLHLRIRIRYNPSTLREK